jgi:hypothetical protein
MHCLLSLLQGLGVQYLAIQNIPLCKDFASSTLRIKLGQGRKLQVRCWIPILEPILSLWNYRLDGYGHSIQGSSV